MVYITGDIHGEVRRVSEMIEKHEITPEDIIVILGDVGMNYYGNKKGDRHRKKKMNNILLIVVSAALSIIICLII